MKLYRFKPTRKTTKVVVTEIVQDFIKPTLKPKFFKKIHPSNIVKFQNTTTQEINDKGIFATNQKNIKTALISLDKDIISEQINYINPKVVFEVGVGNFLSSRTRHYWNRDCEFHLFEPNPEFYKELKNKINRPNVHLHNVAIYKENTEINLRLSSLSSYIEDQTLQREFPPKDYVKVSAKTISEYDNGDIDVLLVDIEGCEWFLLKKIVSKPKLIVLEMNKPINPYLKEIEEWLYKNKYKKIAKIPPDSFYKLH